MGLYHHARIAPCRTSVAWTHTVDHKLLRSGSGRDDKSTGTHTETVHATSVYLSYETVFCGRKILASSILVMILYLVDEMSGMLQTHTHSDAFGLDLNPGGCEIAIHITRTVTCGQDDWPPIGFLGPRLQVDSLDTYHLVAIDDEGGHLGLEMHLAPTLKDGVAHVFYHTRQFVGSYMGMGISQNVGIGSMLAEDIQYLVHTAAFLAAGIQLSIAVGTCSTLTKTIVAFGIHLLGLGNIGEVLLRSRTSLPRSSTTGR